MSITKVRHVLQDTVTAPNLSGVVESATAERDIDLLLFLSDIRRFEDTNSMWKYTAVFNTLLFCRGTANATS